MGRGFEQLPKNFVLIRTYRRRSLSVRSYALNCQHFDYAQCKLSTVNCQL
ncbi:MAG: hypothetical protein LH613_16590 [Chamaesiphon sp.]|nr:hypothetical protein [Chamaesiphon sp.]